MLKEIRSLLLIAISSLEEEGKLSRKNAPDFGVDHTRQKGHGDIASNVALVLAKHVGMSPRGLAEQVIQRLPSSSLIERTEIAGPVHLRKQFIFSLFYAGRSSAEKQVDPENG